MRISKPALDLLAKRDTDFATYLATLAGGETTKQLTATDVHVSSASSERKPKKRPQQPVVDGMKDFAQTVGEIEQPPQMPDMTVGKTFAEIIGEANNVDISKQSARWLKPHPDGGAHVPFPWDAQALDKIPHDQTRRFLGALTDQDSLPNKKVPMSSLVAVQPRVSPEKIASMQQNGYAKLPLVIRNDGKNLLADGNHRAVAAWLDGADKLDCKFCDLTGPDESLMKVDADGSWSIDFNVAKADPDKQQIFGWASIVQEGEYLVIDKQGDMILPEELEDAAYTYVLEARDHGDMHTVVGTGKLIESMVFTHEKQAALRVVLKNENGDQIVGWWVGFKVHSPEVWKLHKEGKRPEFSIGGKSLRNEID